jgi:hypothetical protein
LKSLNEMTKPDVVLESIEKIVNSLSIPKVPEVKENLNKDKLLIMGFSPTTVQDGIEFLKKYPGCECWCMNMFYVSRDFPISLTTRWFEMHEADCNPSVMRDTPEGREHRQNLRGIPIPIYVQNKDKYWDDFGDRVIEFPAKEIVEAFPRAYFSSTPSWIMAFAFLEGIKELKKTGKFRWSKICIAGVDMMSGWNRKYVVQPDGTQKIVDVIASEYASQRPSCEWLIGFFDSLKMMGIDCEFIVPTGSTLMKYNRLYGFENYFNQGITLEIKKRMEIRMKYMDDGINNLRNNMNQIQQKAQQEIMEIQRSLDARTGARQEIELLYSEYCDPSVYLFKEQYDKEVARNEGKSSI